MRYEWMHSRRSFDAVREVPSCRDLRGSDIQDECSDLTGASTCHSHETLPSRTPPMVRNTSTQHCCSVCCDNKTERVTDIYVSKILAGSLGTGPEFNADSAHRLLALVVGRKAALVWTGTGGEVSIRKTLESETYVFYAIRIRDTGTGRWKVSPLMILLHLASSLLEATWSELLRPSSPSYHQPFHALEASN